MYSSMDLPWLKINDFLIDVGSIREPEAFCAQVIKKIYPLIPYDQARIYFVNETGKIYNEQLVGVDQQWSDAYLEYFPKIAGSRYAIPSRSYAMPAKIKDGRYTFPKLGGSVYDRSTTRVLPRSPWARIVA